MTPESRKESSMDCRRNRVAWRLANLALRIGTKRYRMMIEGSIRYGMRAAEAEARLRAMTPRDWAEVNRIEAS